MTTPFVPDSRDQRIHEIIREICIRLNIQKCPHKLLWAERVKTGDSDRSGSKPIGSDECYLGMDTVILPMHMRDKLQPEEWRAVIASGVILEMRLRGRVLRKILNRLVFPPVSLLLLSVFLFVQGPFDSTGNFHGPGWVLPLFAASIGAALLVPTIFYGHYYRQAKLVADQEAAEIVGRQTFLDLMTKLGQMGLKDVDKAKGNHFMSPRLGIDRRINNIQKLL